jgi:Cu2+-exporting ATPase
MGRQSTVLQVGGLDWATSAAVEEQTLRRRPGVLAVEANSVSQTANVTYDPDRTDIAQLSGWVRDCGYHCAGQSVPAHVCDPMAEPGRTISEVRTRHEIQEEESRSAPDVTGHYGGHGGGHKDGHGGTSMDEMVRDLRNRFLVAVVFSVPILLWSPIGREVLGFSAAAPFGLRDDDFSLLLSLR